jgi:small subunit ribosomal protein S18
LSNEEMINDEERVPGARGQRPRRAQRRVFIPRRKVCTFCTDKIDVIDYKRPELLRRFLTDRGKIKPRRRTGTCAKHQRRLAVAIKRARHLALLPYVAEHLRHYG